MYIYSLLETLLLCLRCSPSSLVLGRESHSRSSGRRPVATGRFQADAMNKQRRLVCFTAIVSPKGGVEIQANALNPATEPLKWIH